MSQKAGLPMTYSAELAATTQALLAPGKGLLAADESFPSIEKRFKEVGLPSTEATRLAYRSMLLGAPDLNRYISGVILFDETIHQKIGRMPVVEALLNRQIMPGIKVDKGTAALPGLPGEHVTEGLDGLDVRLSDYRNLGARFTKWRAVITIGQDIPTHAAIATNARILAMFAAMSQEAGLVPIVEPEILMDGSHTSERCEEVTTLTLRTVFSALAEHHVAYEHMLLKTSMVVAGADCPQQAGLDEVATRTLRCFGNSVPAAIPGIVFLSGGQSEDVATAHLNAICARPHPAWVISFSFGRALQAPALKIWQGQGEQVVAAQHALMQRAQANSQALTGAFKPHFDSKRQ